MQSFGKPCFQSSGVFIQEAGPRDPTKSKPSLRASRLTQSVLDSFIVMFKMQFVKEAVYDRGDQQSGCCEVGDTAKERIK